jgi:hypothetical protein
MFGLSVTGCKVIDKMVCLRDLPETKNAVGTTGFTLHALCAFV